MPRLPVLVPGFIALFVFAAFSLALVACGGDDSPSGASAAEPTASGGAGGGGQDSAGVTPAACTLVTQTDVATILGGTAPAGERTQAGPFDSCGYYATLRHFVQFQVCTRCLSPSQFEATIKSGAETLETSYEAVPGIGDKAYWFGDGILWVQKGNFTYNIWVSAPQFYVDGTALEGDALKLVALPVARDLAGKVNSRLP